MISVDPQAPHLLFGELAKRSRKLEALHLIVLMADITNVHVGFFSFFLS